MKKHNLLLVVLFSLCAFLISYSQDESEVETENVTSVEDESGGGEEAVTEEAVEEEEAEPEKPEPSVSLNYYNSNNQLQYLIANVRARVNGKIENVEGTSVKFYIGSEAEENLLGTALTGYTGNALLYIPASAKEAWQSAATQDFVAVVDETERFLGAQGEAAITKAKLQIDTAEDRAITVKLMELGDNGEWKPVPEVDIIVAVKRLGGDLDVSGENSTYTTDENGAIEAYFEREELSGDSKGDLVLVAKVDEHEVYGNLSVEQAVPWGVPTVYEASAYNERTLFARRGRSPFWLEGMAFGIAATVWSILVYLAFQIRKIKQLGTA
jgi:hypothetical protein